MEGLTSDMVLVLVILAGTVALFVTEIVRIDVAAIGVMVVIGLTGLVPAAEVFAGFSSNAVISIIAVMILGAGLDRVGVMRSVAAWLLRVGGETERRVLVSVSATVGALSAFLQNIGAAALFLPVVERVAERTGLAASRLLMPMGFAAILGGTLTLVASGPLILLNDLLASSAENIDQDIDAYGLFAPTPIGLAILASGIALFALAGRWLLPSVPTERGSSAAVPDVAMTYGLDRELRPARVPQGSPLLDDTVGVIEARSGRVRVVAVSDHEGVALGPSRDERIAADVTVVLVGHDDCSTVARKAQCHLPAEAAASTGHDCDPTAGFFLGHPASPCVKTCRATSAPLLGAEKEIRAADLSALQYHLHAVETRCGGIDAADRRAFCQRRDRLQRVDRQL